MRVDGWVWLTDCTSIRRRAQDGEERAESVGDSAEEIGVEWRGGRGGLTWKRERAI